MTDGHPGDHPLTDIFLNNEHVLGEEGDNLLRRLAEEKGLFFAKIWFEQNLYLVPFDREEKKLIY